jgi:DNA-directed RNA polymerase specialized sigma24 family protein
MKKEWLLSQDAFDSLLNWLDTDREKAGCEYEKIRLRLIKLFTCRGCYEDDALADEVINRVAAKVHDIAPTYTGDPALYFYGVANKVYLEYIRKLRPTTSSLPPTLASQEAASDPATIEESEWEYRCLERCMEELPTETRHLVLQYYREEKGAKIEHRKRLARELGVALNALRIRAYRVRVQLQRCVLDCLERQPAN